jgi:hypothetical protein
MKNLFSKMLILLIVLSFCENLSALENSRRTNRPPSWLAPWPGKVWWVPKICPSSPGKALYVGPSTVPYFGTKEATMEEQEASPGGAPAPLNPSQRPISPEHRSDIL